MNFNTYISMLGQQIMMLLGKMPNPVTGKPEKNLEGAKIFIDVLDLLKEKTKGNLTKDENTLLQSTLSNMRMIYVEVVNESK